MTPAFAPSSAEAVEIRRLLSGIYEHYGFDFRDYAFASIRRRILARVRTENCATVPAFQEKILRDPECLYRFLVGVTVHTTSMFRDPKFYRVLREVVVPRLKTYPFIRIWFAGCSSGEEVFSLAILLEEEGIIDRCRVYATDLSDAILERARQGIFRLDAIKEYTRNYQAAGGRADFSDYYTAHYDNAIFRPELVRRVVFAQHNLVTDTSFNEFQFVICRNVMIYFEDPLQARVHELIFESLSALGFLALGAGETLRFTPRENDYEAVSETAKVFRKKGRS